MSYRVKTTIVHGYEVRTFNQGMYESVDEFRGRVGVEMAVPAGERYHHFEQIGHRYNGHVGPHTLGKLRVRREYSSDEMLPGLFVLVNGKVHDSSEML